METIGEYCLGTPEFTNIKWKPSLINYKSTNYVPLYHAHTGDSGVDLTSMTNTTIWPFCRAIIPTGVCLELTEGLEGQVRPKSGLMSKGLMASFGTIDQGYRGEVKVVLFNFSFWPKVIKVGDYIAQLVISNVVEVEYKLGEIHCDTPRGADGFGSTGGKYES